MEFFDYSLKLFNQIEQTDFSNFSGSSEHPVKGIVSYLSTKITFDKFTELYRKEIDIIIDEHLPMCKDDDEQVNNLKKIYYYDGSVNTYTWMYLFWIWYNKIDISSNDLKFLLKGVFMGMMGFRLIDIYTDDEGPNKDYLFLGNYLIRNFEQIFVDVFGSKETFDVLNYYGLKFNEVEYLEKRNLWKKCPFSWEKSNMLGYKTSPLLSLFDVIFTHFRIDKNKSDALVQGFLNVLAVNQITDDLGDAETDLAVGRETLVMQGFYEKYGTVNSWSKENIAEFLTQEKLMQIYNEIQDLTNNGIALFSKHDDLIFLIFVEMGRQVFLKNFEIKSIEPGE
jgi:hypothetical protein